MTRYPHEAIGDLLERIRREEAIRRRREDKQRQDVTHEESGQ